MFLPQDHCLKQYYLFPNPSHKDQFQVPDRIYGRETQLNALLNSVHQVSQQSEKQILLVTGPAGIGKTAIVTQVQRLMTANSPELTGQFIHGKFDQVNRRLPLSAILQAFRGMIAQWRNSDKQINLWRQLVLAQIGEEAAILTEVLPELQQVIGTQPLPKSLLGEAQGNRLTLIFLRFLRALTSMGQPLVLFLDDAQWADLASLQLIERWMTDSQLGHFLCILSYRPSEVPSHHPLRQFIECLPSKGILPQTLTISPLSQTDLNTLIAQTLHCSIPIAEPLGLEIWQRTQGNPFFTLQLFHAFYQDGYLTYNAQQGTWQCDLSQIRAAHVSLDIVDFMLDRLRRFPSPTRSLLSIAASLGHEFSLERLAQISEQSSMVVASYLWRALREGLIIPTRQPYQFSQDSESSPSIDDHSVTESQGAKVFGNLVGTAFQESTYRFLHDRVQQAAYQLIEPSQRAKMHLSIARGLAKSYEAQLSAGILSDSQLFYWIGQANQGRSAIEDPEELVYLAHLNQCATRRAIANTAYQCAWQFATTGIEQLPKQPWRSHESLTRSLYELAAESAYLSGEFEQVPAFIQILHQQASSKLDHARADELQMNAYAAAGKPLDAINLALSALRYLEIPLPRLTDRFSIYGSLLQFYLLLGSRSPESFLALPEMQDQTSLFAMRILATLGYLTSFATPEFVIPLAVVALKLALRHGNSPYSAYAYSWCAAILSMMPQTVNWGDKLGEVALTLARRSSDPDLISRISVGLIDFSRHTKHPLGQLVQELAPTYEWSLKAGNFNTATWAIHSYLYHRYFAGESLVELEQCYQQYWPIVQPWNQVGALRFIDFTQNTVLQWRSLEIFPYRDSNYPIQYETYLAKAKAESSLSEIFCCAVLDGLVRYSFGDYELAYQRFQQAQPYEQAGMTLIVAPLYHFYRALNAIACYPTASKRMRWKLRWHIRRGKSRLKQLKTHCPETYAHKYYLILAEEARLNRHPKRAISIYETAIALAAGQNFQHEVALAYECYAQCAFQMHNPDQARRLLQQAYAAYEQWGAIAKLKQLKHQYPEVFSQSTAIGITV